MISKRFLIMELASAINRFPMMYAVLKKGKLDGGRLQNP